MVFALLVSGAFLIFGVKLPRKRNKISISKAAVKDKKKDVDEKYAKLRFSEKIYVAIKNTVSMSGFGMNVFWFMVVIAAFIGFGIGKFLFKPDININRAEVVTVVNRATGRTPDKEYISENYTKLDRFTDVKDSNAWFFFEVYEASNDHMAYETSNGENWLK